MLNFRLSVRELLVLRRIEIINYEKFKTAFSRH